MAKISRNEPCPCGSGQKYKRCCLGKEDEEEVLLKSVIENMDLQSVTKKKGRLVFSFVDPSEPDAGGDIPLEGWFAGDPDKDDTFRQVFLGEGAEDFTDDLIAELAGRSWSEPDLRRMKAEGAKYNRIRDSIVYPPETFSE